MVFVKTQDRDGIRVEFLLDTFLWLNKEKYLGCRSDKSAGLTICMHSTRRAKHMDVFRETDIQTNRRDSDTNLKFRGT